MKYLDKIIIGISLIGGLVAGFFIFKPVNTDNVQVKSLANVGELLGEAKVRREGLVGWRNLQEGDVLYPKDSVVSLDETFMRLDLQDGTSLNLTPNTLVYLVKDADKLDIDLQRGFLGMNLVNLKNRIVVNVGKKELEIKSQNAKVHVSLDEGNQTNLTVIDGLASIIFKGNEISMKKGEKVKLDENATKMDVSTFAIGPQRPGMDKIIFKEEGKSVDFEWDSLEKVEEYNVTAARDPQFKSIIGKVTTKDKKASFDFAEEGRYYWQVVGLVQNKVKTEAPVYSFMVKKNSSPSLIYPGANAVIELPPKDETMTVTLRWESQNSERYEVELFKYGLEKEKGEIVSSDTNYIEVPGLDPKEYKWRVRVIDRLREDTEWSEFRNFVISDYKAMEGRDQTGPRRRREFFDEQSGEWKKKEK